MNRALLVGIDAYPNLPLLRGCVNDVIDMANLLVKNFNFLRSDIDLIINTRATTDAIKQRISRLTSGIRSGDRIFFHYSGHGAQYAERDPNGNVTSLHDVICPVDFDNSRDRMITDTDFKNFFANIPLGAEFNWVSDSCHSGDLSRNTPLPSSGGEGEYRIPRLFPIPADMQWRIGTAQSQGLRSLGLDGVAKNLNGALIAACGSNETAYPVPSDGGYNGALTFALKRLLGDTKELQTPLTSLIIKVQEEIIKLGLSSQHPQLQGNPSITAKPFLG